MSLPLASLLADTDLCVKCGLCLPHCPTYELSRQEGDGPRGRIALAQGLARDLLLPTAPLLAHLDGCLACRACEAVCPAKVPYGRVLDAARARLATPARTRSTRLLGAVLGSASARALLRCLLWLMQPLAPLLRRLARLKRTPRLARLASLWPRFGRLAAPQSASQGSVAIFIGCVGDVLERQLAQDLLELLAALGIRAVIPVQQGCCGALHQHGGLPAAAAESARRNAQAFAGAAVILPLASGCATGLIDGDAALGSRLRDPSAWLAEQLEARPLALARLKLRVAVHSACTQVNVLRAGGASERLLRLIPGIELRVLAPAGGCCGAAGTHFLSQPATADALLAPKLASVDALAPDLIVSPNIGCSLHLAAGLRRQGQDVEVLHPISLLARAWRAAL